MLGQSADRDRVDPGLGNLPQPILGDPPGGLEPRASSGQFHRASQRWRIEVIQQHLLDASLQRLAQPRQGLDLDLNRNLLGQATGRRDRGADRAGRGDMVLLDQDRIEQAHAMVVATTANNGILLRSPQPRKRLARIQETHRQPRHRIGGAPRAGRGAREQLQIIERGPLAGEERAQATGERAEPLPRPHRLAIARLPVDTDLGIELTEDLIEPSAAAEHRVFTGDDLGARDRVRRQQAGGQIARADILRQRLAHLRLDQRQWRQCASQRLCARGGGRNSGGHRLVSSRGSSER